MPPLVTVVIPTYNRGFVLRRTLENVFAQTYPHVEVIVVDDGSTDDTKEVLRPYEDRIKVITQSNGGPAAARNRGIDAARGGIVAFQDSDDLWKPAKLARQVAILDAAGPMTACCLSNARMEFNTHATTSFRLGGLRLDREECLLTNAAEFLATSFLLFNQCVAVRTEVLRALGGFNEKMRVMEDYDLALRLALKSPTWALVNEPLTIWRQGSPDSAYDSAMRHRKNVRSLWLESHLSAMNMIPDSPAASPLRRIMGCEIESTTREISYLEMREGNAFSSLLGQMLLRVERYRKALYRRTGLYPRPKFADVPVHLGRSPSCSIGRAAADSIH